MIRRVGGCIRDWVENVLRDFGGWHFRRMAKLVGIGMLGAACLILFFGGIETVLVLYLSHKGVPIERLMTGVVLGMIFTLAPVMLSLVWAPVIALKNRHSPEQLDACAREGWETITGCLAILFFPVAWILKKFWRRGGTVSAAA